MNKDDLKKPLKECLESFKGAPEGDKEKRLNALADDFVLLAKKLLHGGFFVVGDRYRIELEIVEFYYHEEKKDIKNRICDYIVYHRNGNYPPSCGNEELPYFPIMSLHAHPSGIDITFENPEPEKEYRASALIRAYSIFDEKKKEYIAINDNRSQYLYYYLNGFQINGNGNHIKWKEKENVDYDTCPIYRGRRKNVFEFVEQNENGIIKIEDKKVFLDNRKWGFSKRENTKVKHSRSKKDNSDSFSNQEEYLPVTRE